MSNSEIVLKNWSYRKDGTEEWFQSRKEAACTEIFADLLNNGQIPDPFLDTNERDVQWVGEQDWQYLNSFEVDSALKDLENHELVFEGLDTFATVWLNGKELLKANNMFVEYRVDAKPHLNFGGVNELLIKFDSALRTSRSLEKKHGQYKCFNGETSRLQVRKAQYHYGWDWGPILMTCGPHLPVKLVSFNSIIDDVYVNSQISEKLNATIDVQTDIRTKSQVAIDIEVISPSGKVIEKAASKVDKNGLDSFKFDIQNPELWYPLGHGEASLYTFKVTLSNLKEIQTVIKKVGLRRVELVQEKLIDQPGTSFYFKVNNIPIYSTGSNWIPCHSMKTLMTDQDYTDWLQLAVDGNQNMIRVWGGGYYETDIFYDECDRLGLLVWQDFMFACGQYPGFPEFIETCKPEFDHQIKRLRNHACMAVYAGNNEDYQVAENFGLHWDQNDHSGDYSKTDFPARTIYEKVIPDALKSLNPQVPYHPGSPWGGSHTTDPTIGDIHQWNVWHGTQEKYQDWYKLGGRFISEFGMEALPNRKTYEDCITDKTELYPQSESIDHHNKSDGFERRLALYVFENIKVEGLDLDSWIYATQLMQAECLGYAYRCWRREWRGEGKRYTSGAIVWQINDCWPVASWAIIDFYKRPKLGYYSVKRESHPIGVGLYRNEKKFTHEQAKPVSKEGAPHDYSKTEYNVDIWGVNATTEPLPSTLKIDIYNVTLGDIIESLPDKPVTLSANATTEFVESHPISNDVPVVIYARLVDNKGNIIAGAADWPQPLKYLKFNDRKVDFTVENGQIRLRANNPVKGVEIIVERDVFLQDNGFDLFPGDDKIVVAKDLKATDKVSIRYYQQAKK
ncbi:beta-mannosidase precursor [Hyphopichia burtonii NRRL Y-1933]|uniref:Beta-mannosidase B n=1 Tax=Hyphopichia burtonii NRRL Y-1933 TaxID=984485 RepID=A0A1E4RTI0_9ASCO|nr:beta-mannosidase precursor [Hyphopichia burtonii NRRL Y-1933]ODV70556.1 beta-mannosidase precursor [Hyphopichia burtonii NRRL Y-1933]